MFVYDNLTDIFCVVVVQRIKPRIMPIVIKNANNTAKP